MTIKLNDELIEVVQHANPNIDHIKILIKEGADVNIRADNKFTPLMFAIAEGHKEIVEILIDAGADIYATLDGGAAALAIAASKGNEEILKILLKKGEYNYILTNTALLYAVVNGYNSSEVVKILLEAKADPNASTENGRTALMLAVEYSKFDKISASWKIEIIKLLLEKGADIEAEDKDGNTSLMIATILGKTEIVELLKSKLKTINKNQLNLDNIKQEKMLDLQNNYVKNNTPDTSNEETELNKNEN